MTVTAAAISLVIVTLLAYAKHRLDTQMASRALQALGTLSGIGGRRQAISRLCAASLTSSTMVTMTRASVMTSMTANDL